MNPVIQTILDAQDDCTRILAEIIKVLSDERTSLVCLQINEIAETTRLKGNLNSQLIQKSKRLKKLVEGNFENLDNFEERIDSNDLMHWKEKREAFWMLHAEVKIQCGINQNFLKSSLRNLGTLSDNLRRLFGEQPLYSQKGTKVDRSAQGKVLEARY